MSLAASPPTVFTFVDLSNYAPSTSGPSTTVSPTIIPSSAEPLIQYLIYNTLTIKNMSRGLRSSITVLLKIIT